MAKIVEHHFLVAHAENTATGFLESSLGICVAPLTVYCRKKNSHAKTIRLRGQWAFRTSQLWSHVLVTFSVTHPTGMQSSVVYQLFFASQPGNKTKVQTTHSVLPWSKTTQPGTECSLRDMSPADWWTPIFTLPFARSPYYTLSHLLSLQNQL